MKNLYNLDMINKIEIYDFNKHMKVYHHEKLVKKFLGMVWDVKPETWSLSKHRDSVLNGYYGSIQELIYEEFEENSKVYKDGFIYRKPCVKLVYTKFEKTIFFDTFEEAVNFYSDVSKLINNKIFID